MPEANPALTPAAALARLFATVGLAGTGYIATMTVASLLAEELLGAATWSGVPGALAILGVGVGAPLFSGLMARRGRADGLSAGYLLALSGAATAAVAAARGSFALLALGFFACGVGYSANHLARYAAAELQTGRAAAGIAWMVWAGTIGAVAGPALLAPGRRLAEALSLAPLSGAPLLGAVALSAALLASRGLRAAPFAPFPPRASGSGPPPPPEAPIGSRARFAILALMVNQLVMVLVMAMTPIHIRRGGESLGAVGVVLGAHMLGMFGFAPLAGALAERAGRLPTLCAGHALAAAATLLAAGSGGAEVGRLALALFLLGLGWSLGFVSGSALLTESAGDRSRLRLQGRGDALVAGSAALASLASGALLAAGGYAFLNLLGALLATLPLGVALLARQRLRAVAAT